MDDTARKVVVKAQIQHFKVNPATLGRLGYEWYIWVTNSGQQNQI